jgi:hypothetical protein
MDRYPLSEMKLIYRVLHGHLAEHPDLMDSQWLEELQRHLQKVAQAEGVDVGHHAAWDAWLGNAAASCETRAAGRRLV